MKIASEIIGYLLYGSSFKYWIVFVIDKIFFIIS